MLVNRFASRLALYSKRSITGMSRNGVLANLRQPTMYGGLLAMNFSKNIKKPETEEVDNKLPTLSESLASELQEEIDAASEIDQEFLDLKAKVSNDFKIMDTDGSCVVTLVHENDKEKVEVVFNVEDMTDSNVHSGEEHDHENEHGEEDDAQHDEDFATDVKFTVAVTKKTSGDKIVLYCDTNNNVDEEGEEYQPPVVIDNVQFVPAGKEAFLEPNAGSSHASERLYAGPLFSTLTDDVKDGFEDYLAERHVDEDLGVFISQYASYKEQREYTNWLKQMVLFVGDSVKQTSGKK